MGVINHICRVLDRQGYAIGRIITSQRLLGFSGVVASVLLIWQGYEITKLEERLEKLEEAQKDG